MGQLADTGTHRVYKLLYEVRSSLDEPDVWVDGEQILVTSGYAEDAIELLRTRVANETDEVEVEEEGEFAGVASPEVVTKTARWVGFRVLSCELIAETDN